LLNLDGIELDRWEKGIDHDPRSQKIVKALEKIDFQAFNNYFDWQTGGDGDNGEALMYQLDVYFDLLDKGRI